MKATGRKDRLESGLIATLDSAAGLAARGRESFDSDPALPLAFEALANRIGHISKKLVAADPERFTHSIWSQAARNRDVVVHHYSTVDPDILWRTVTTSFPEMRAEADRALRP